MSSSATCGFTRAGAVELRPPPDEDPDDATVTDPLGDYLDSLERVGRRRPPVPPDDPDTDAAEPVLTAAGTCPAEAVSLTLRGSGEPVFPPEE
ncbi:hypothetical protein [Streptomyces sp. NPDC001056]